MANFLFVWTILITISNAGHYFNPPMKYDKICDVTKYGAKGDGKTNDTKSILSAINDCYSNNKSAQVLFPSGYTFLSSALYMNYPFAINCSFTIEEGTTLLATYNVSLWPQGYAFISLQKMTNIVIEGSGTVNGNGAIWQGTSQVSPRLMDASDVNGLIVRDLSFINCANHCLELGANFAEIYNISIINPPSNNNSLNATINSYGTDGIDVHGTPCYIHDSIISTGDDNVAVKTANDTLIENCFFGYGHGTSIGSLEDGQFIKNITVNNCTYHETDAGTHIKIHPDATSGHLWDVRFTNLNMSGIAMYSIGITEYYGSSGNVSTFDFLVENVLYENITSYQNSSKINKDPPGEFMCQPSRPCKNITMKNIKIVPVENHNVWMCSEVDIHAIDVEPPLKNCS